MTWSATAKALKDSGKLGDGVYPFACPVDFQTWYYQTVYANGGYILSDDKKSTGYDDPKTQEGIQCWIDMYNEGLSPSASALSETTSRCDVRGWTACNELCRIIHGSRVCKQ